MSGVLKRDPQVYAAILAAYGNKSCTLVARELGVTSCVVVGCWYRARQAGRLTKLFGRFDGAAHRPGRTRLGSAGAQAGEVIVEQGPKRRRAVPQTVEAASPPA